MPRKKRVSEAKSSSSSYRNSLLFDLFHLLSTRKIKNSPAVEYLRKAELEFLKALNVLVEHQIEGLEKRMASRKGGRVRKIEVDED